jgi:hypothetical protein
MYSSGTRTRLGTGSRWMLDSGASKFYVASCEVLGVGSIKHGHEFKAPPSIGSTEKLKVVDEHGLQLLGALSADLSSLLDRSPPL